MARISPLFSKLYAKLNRAQKRAVDAIEGPVMVVAGPGTGKTHVLTLRIANILRTTDTPPDGILALTFTESGANTMRRRLAEIIGPAAYRVRIHTFHGFCKDVIERCPDEFPRIIGSTPLTEVERITILRDLIREGTWEHLRPFGDPYYYLNPARQAISEMKRENIAPDFHTMYLDAQEKEFAAIPDLYYEKGAYKGKMKGAYQARAKVLVRTRELNTLYRAYEAALESRRKYDFEDMIMEVVAALENNGDLLLRVQEDSMYILADEHQDANAAQNRLLELLASFHDNPNLFVVGDDKQAIFRFQGASLENFNYFKTRFPRAQMITLTESYRSGQAILDTAHALISASPDSSHVPLESKTGSKSLIHLRVFSTEEHERTWVAREIQRLISEGVDPSHIAILYRANSEAEGLAIALEAVGVPVSIESDQNALADPDLRKFLALVRAVARFGQDGALSRALHLDALNIPPLDAYKMARHAARKDLLIADVMQSKDELAAAGISKPTRIQGVYANLERWAASRESVPMILEDMLRESGFLGGYLQSPRAEDLLAKAGGFLRDAETLSAADPDYTLRDFAAHLELLEEFRVPVRKMSEGVVHRGVRLMTAHRSKGMEFEYVYVVNVADGVWGGRREMNRFELPTGAASGSDEDERRLLYVALTRGKLGVDISYARASKSGSERLGSRLLEDIDARLLQSEEMEDATHAASLRLLRGRSKRPRTIDKTYVRELFMHQGLSVTALNNYLSCPWEYFYMNLVRVPRVPQKEQLFGTAVHMALKRFFDERIRDKKVAGKDLVQYFEDAMHGQPLPRQTRDEMRVRGATFLLGWYTQNHVSWPKTLRTEYAIDVHLPVELEGLSSLRLRGNLDKIEEVDGGVNVVDYKTGAPKSRNAIQGKTKHDTGDYWRQLQFYRLLLDLEGKCTFVSAELDFVQPDPRGKYHKEVFRISKDEVTDLRRDIQRVASEIWDLKFWGKRCGKKDCEHCGFRELMA